MSIYRAKGLNRVFADLFILLCFVLFLLLLLYFIEKQTPRSCAAIWGAASHRLSSHSCLFPLFSDYFLSCFSTKGMYSGLIRRFSFSYVWSTLCSPSECQNWVLLLKYYRFYVLNVVIQLCFIT